jgi:hypothetical protein
MILSKVLKPIFTSCVILLFLFSCSSDELENDCGTSVVSISLKSSMNLENDLYIEIEDIQFRVKQQASLNNAWVSLNTINEGVVNMSDLNADADMLLVHNENIPSIPIYEIRLVLGDQNFIDSNGLLIDLDTENLGKATATNFLELNLLPNQEYDITIDFDTDQSVYFSELENVMVLSPKIYTEIRHLSY